MRIERHQSSERIATIMGRFMIIKNNDVLTISLSQSGVRVLHAWYLTSILGPCSIGVWVYLSRDRSKVLSDSSLSFLVGYWLMASLISVLLIHLDFGFAPLAFDRRTGRVERRGRNIGRLDRVYSILIVRNSGGEGGNISYLITLSISGYVPGRHLLIELGNSSERAEVLAFASQIADFLGVEISDASEPMPPLKPRKPAREVDLE